MKILPKTDYFPSPQWLKYWMIFHTQGPHSDLNIIDDNDEMLALCLVIILFGIVEAHRTCVHCCNVNQLYLHQQDLLPNPCIGTPWQILYAARNDHAFITTMGFDVETFHHLLEGQGRFAEQWDLSTIPRNDHHDVATIGEPCLGGHSLDAMGGLGLVLHYLGSAMLEISLQQIFALTPSTVSHYIDFTKKILLQTVRSMKDGAIRLP